MRVPPGLTRGAGVGPWRWAVRAGCVRTCARAACAGGEGSGAVCVVRCARVCPECARAWRRARDPAAVVRARPCAPAGAQHRLRPGVCVRGVSERASEAAERGGLRSAAPGTPFPGRPGTDPAPAPAPAPRRGGSWARPAPPPLQLAAGWGLPAERRGRREGPAGGRAEARVLCRVRAAGGGRGRAGPPGGRPAALQEPREQKETATAPPRAKQPALAAAQGPAGLAP